MDAKNTPEASAEDAGENARGQAQGRAALARLTGFFLGLYYEENGRPRLPFNGWIGFWGVALIAAAVIMEHPKVAEALSILDYTDWRSYVFSLKTGASFLKEVGFALLIAFFISAGIERQAREREEKHNEKSRRQIAKDVFHGVFGLAHDRGYVKNVIRNILLPAVVRDHYHVEYTIEVLTPAELSILNVKKGRFVKFHIISTYNLENISDEALVDYEITYALAVRGATKLREFAVVNRVSFDRGPLAEKEIREGLRRDDQDHKFYAWPRAMGVRQKIEVMVCATIIKEMSDNEVWRNMRPTIGGGTFKLQDNTRSLRVGIRSLTSTVARPAYSGPAGSHTWTIEGAILPNESVVVWWRTAEDDGEAAGTPPPAKPTRGLIAPVRRSVSNKTSKGSGDSKVAPTSIPRPTTRKKSPERKRAIPQKGSKT